MPGEAEVQAVFAALVRAGRTNVSPAAISQALDGGLSPTQILEIVAAAPTGREVDALLSALEANARVPTAPARQNGFDSGIDSAARPTPQFQPPAAAPDPADALAAKIAAQFPGAQVVSSLPDGRIVIDVPGQGQKVVREFGAGMIDDALYRSITKSNDVVEVGGRLVRVNPDGTTSVIFEPPQTAAAAGRTLFPEERENLRLDNELLQRKLAENPNLKVISDERTGQTLLLDTQTGQTRPVGQFGFPGIDPERAQVLGEAGATGFLGGRPTLERERFDFQTGPQFAEDTRRFDIGFGAQQAGAAERAGMDRATLAEEARQANLTSATRGFESVNTLAPKLGQLALENAGFTRDVLRTPADFLARAFFQRGQTSPLPQISQADVANQLRSNIGQFNEAIAGFAPQVGAFQPPPAFAPFVPSPSAAAGSVPAPGSLPAPVTSAGAGRAAPPVSAAPGQTVGPGGFQVNARGEQTTTPAIFRQGPLPGGQTGPAGLAMAPPGVSNPAALMDIVRQNVARGAAAAPPQPPTAPPVATAAVSGGQNGWPEPGPDDFTRAFRNWSAADLSGKQFTDANIQFLESMGANPFEMKALRAARKAQIGFRDGGMDTMSPMVRVGEPVDGKPNPEMIFKRPGDPMIVVPDHLMKTKKKRQVASAQQGGIFGLTGFTAPRLPVPDAVTQDELRALEASVRPPALSSVLAGQMPSPLRFGFSLPTPGIMSSLTKGEREAFGTTLAVQHNTGVEDVEQAIRERFGDPGQRRRATTFGFAR